MRQLEEISIAVSQFTNSDAPFISVANCDDLRVLSLDLTMQFEISKGTVEALIWNYCKDDPADLQLPIIRDDEDIQWPGLQDSAGEEEK